MPDSQERSGLDFETPTSGVNHSFYNFVPTVQPDDLEARGKAVAPQIAKNPNPSGGPQLPKRPIGAPQGGYGPVPKPPAPKSHNNDKKAKDADYDPDASEDTDSEANADTDSDTDSADTTPVAPRGGLLPVKLPVGDNARFNACLKRFQFPTSADYLVGMKAALRLDPAHISPDFQAFRTSTWKYEVKLQLSEKKESFKRIYIDWEDMTSALGVEVGDAVTLKQASEGGSRDITFDVIIEKGGGVEELADREKDGRCKRRRGATMPTAAGEDERQEKPKKVQKKTLAAMKTPGKAPNPPSRQTPAAPPSAPRPSTAQAVTSPASRRQNLNMCLEIMNRRNVNIQTQAAFQLAFLKAEPAVAAQVLRSLAVANQGAKDNAHVHQTVDLLMELLG